MRVGSYENSLDIWKVLCFAFSDFVKWGKVLYENSFEVWEVLLYNLYFGLEKKEKKMIANVKFRKFGCLQEFQVKVVRWT